MYFGKPRQFIDAIRLRYEIIKSNISLRDKLFREDRNEKSREGGGFRGRGKKREGQRGTLELKGVKEIRQCRNGKWRNGIE